MNRKIYFPVHILYIVQLFHTKIVWNRKWIYVFEHSEIAITIYWSIINLCLLCTRIQKQYLYTVDFTNEEKINSNRDNATRILLKFVNVVTGMDKAIN